MPYKPPKYQPFGKATKRPDKSFNERSSDKRKERQKYYASYEWKKFRSIKKRSQRFSDEELINSLISKGVVSWQDVKEWFNDTKHSPLCIRCLNVERYRAAKVLDHIKPFRPEKGMVLCDESNIQWLCDPCHNRKSGSENRLR